jgi:L-threonylcarbamoyladenylate synthase
MTPTPIWPANLETISRAAKLLREGGLVAFPTETVYGLGANALDECAVQKIFTAKGRPSTNPVIVHVTNIEQVHGLVAEWPELAERLAAAFWPGPLTLVLPKQDEVPEVVTAGGPTVAIRWPKHAIASALISETGVPLAAPSANRSTELSPTTAEHVLASLNGRIDAILDGGPCLGGIESTVVEVSDAVRILRPGLISRRDLERVVGEVVVDSQPHSIAKSPGQMSKHYCPRTPLILAETPSELAGLLEQLAGLKVTVLPNWDTPTEAANRLYATLHELDAQGYDRLVLQLPPDEPEWAGVRDRLRRAQTRLPRTT